jgi:hypothetical protein
MEIKRFQVWRKINYGDAKKFKFWSPQMSGKGDGTLTKGAPLNDWKKVIIFSPRGYPKTAFSIGFKDISGLSKISRAIRRVEQGPFGMRMGPEDCNFFVASNEGEVRLEVLGYADINDKTRSKLPLY